MKNYFQKLFQALTITYNVWFNPQAASLHKRLYFFSASNEFIEEMESKDLNLLEVKNQLISRIAIQKKAIFNFQMQGVSYPIYLN